MRIPAIFAAVLFVVSSAKAEEQAASIAATASLRGQQSVIIRIHNASERAFRLNVDDPGSKESYWGFVPFPVDKVEKQTSILWAYITDLKTGEVTRIRVKGDKNERTKNEAHTTLQSGSHWGWEINLDSFGSPKMNENSSLHFIFTDSSNPDAFFSTAPIKYSHQSE